MFNERTVQRGVETADEGVCKRRLGFTLSATLRATHVRYAQAHASDRQATEETWITE